MEKIKINLGCGWRNFGNEWIHIDNGDYPHLDIKTDIRKIDLPDNYADLIYVSHVICYFDSDEIVSILNEWKRILKPNGILRLSTPDFKILTNLYTTGKLNLNGIVGPLFGKMRMGDEKIFHKITYDHETITNLLSNLGFTNIKKYNWRDTCHSNCDDHSQAYIPHMDKENGTLISINIECSK